MRYVLARTGQAAVVLLAAFTASFVLLQALPGDAILIKFDNPELGLSAEQLAAVRTAYGADASPLTQYLHTLTGFLGGDLGYSVQYGTPVGQLLGEALPATATLAVAGFVTAVLLALGIAAAATLAPLRWLRTAAASLPSLLAAVPVFWLGIVLVQVLSFRLGLVRTIGAGPVESLVLPVLTLAVPIAAPLAQVLLRSIDTVSAQPFVAVTTAKGASRRWLLTRTVARNALPPTVAIAGVLLGELIGGAVVTETVFGRAGIGRVAEQAVANQDVPVLQAVVVLAAAVFTLVNLAVDLLYPVLDPRAKVRLTA
ncbi:ABC transporter permease [Georgenia sp. TF02-10]|uniref:ABC transporter permease n=1 Tax=Georgenia sp. TF02-10 TaxID=2917725 RepID=UPI001FA7C9CF|nr:ABC transporter permease [Georgenia sp. TF02-10]UNX53814.1 ABC transporter permease [Georgenia sp. TF02-10]